MLSKLLYIVFIFSMGFMAYKVINLGLEINHQKELIEKTCDDICKPYQRLECNRMSVETKIVCHDPVHGAREVWIPTVK